MPHIQDFVVRLPSAMLASFSMATRIHPFLSRVDRAVGFWRTRRKTTSLLAILKDMQPSHLS